MKVELDKDPVFDRKESPLQGIKDRQRQKSNERGSRRFSLSTKRELQIEVIDPLPQELRKYKREVTYNRITERSRARQNLKKYIGSQERNLKHVRLEKIALDQDPRESSLTVGTHNIAVNFLPIRDQNKKLKQIDIPKIDAFFKDQIRDKYIHENRKLSKILGTRHSMIDETLKKFKDYGPEKTDFNFFGPSKEITQDQILQENAKKQQSLIAKLEAQKKLFSKLETTGSNNEDISQALIDFQGTKRTKKQTLKGIRTYTVRDGEKTMQISPPTMLLYELHKLSDEKQKKQLQLSSLIKNSYQNRIDTMLDKSTYYDEKISFHDLSPQSQFQLRLVMNQKLSHRLELSKEQVHNFVAYLHEIKEQHIIINEQVIEILSRIRQNMLGGKTMKRHDLEQILESYQKQDLKQHPTANIVGRLFSMMI